MAWFDRLRQAAYTSPSGVRVVFDYEDVASQVLRRDKAFEFPDVNGTYVQQHGYGGRRYPLRVFFWGADHDLRASEFDALMLEPGVGQLEHPLYGVVKVVPFGEIARSDRLKTEANQTIFEILFWETTGLVYPTSAVDPASAVLGVLVEFNGVKAEEFNEVIALTDSSARAGFKSRYNALLESAHGALARVAYTKASVEKQFNAIYDSIDLGIDVLVADPLTLAFQTMILLQAPARAAALIGDRLAAYGNLLGDILGGSPSEARSFHTDDLYASAVVSGMVVSAVNSEFETRAGAIAVAEILLEQMEILVAWRDTNLGTFEIIDPGGAYQRLQEAVVVAAGFLVEISFTLKQERRIVLTRPRTAIDLVAELYGEVDGQLDFFLRSNSLTGSEILEIPRGREIVFYV